MGYIVGAAHDGGQGQGHAGGRGEQGQGHCSITGRDSGQGEADAGTNVRDTHP